MLFDRKKAQWYYGKVLNDLLEGLRDLIFPHNCLICKKHCRVPNRSAVLCMACAATIEHNRPPFCKKCSRHLAGDATHLLCAECRVTTHHFDCAWSPAIYNKTVKELIHLFKYKNRVALRTLFTEMVHSFIVQYHIDLTQFDAIAAIPLHPARLRERGYNQSQLIADDLATLFHLTPSRNNLIRTRHTKNQALLGKKERWTNIHGAFRIINPLEYKDKAVLMVDDLLTTGATASEAARVIKQAGAHTVGVVTVAIAPALRHTETGGTKHTQ